MRNEQGIRGIEGSVTSFADRADIVVNTLKGAGEVVDRLGRQPVCKLETMAMIGCFCELNGYVPTPEAIVNTFCMQDLIERYNRYHDELPRNSTDGNYRDDGEFTEQIGEFITGIGRDLFLRYPPDEARKRLMAIDNAFEIFAHTSSKLESQIGSSENGLDHDQIREYRENSDEPWLRTLLITLTDGDADLANKNFDTLFAGVILYQFADDFANMRRNHHVGKPAFFSDCEYTSLPREIRTLIEAGNPYIDKINFSQPVKMLIKTVWLARCVFTNRMTGRKGNCLTHYGNDGLYDSCNAFERNVVRGMQRLARRDSQDSSDSINCNLNHTEPEPSSDPVPVLT